MLFHTFASILTSLSFGIIQVVQWLVILALACFLSLSTAAINILRCHLDLKSLFFAELIFYTQEGGNMEGFLKQITGQVDQWNRVGCIREIFICNRMKDKSSAWIVREWQMEQPDPPDAQYESLALLLISWMNSSASNHSLQGLQVDRSADSPQLEYLWGHHWISRQQINGCILMTGNAELPVLFEYTVEPFQHIHVVPGCENPRQQHLSHSWLQKNIFWIYEFFSKILSLILRCSLLKNFIQSWLFICRFWSWPLVA